MDPVRDNFIKSLSNYSLCIKPYLRQIQDKYVVAQYIVEKDKVDLNAYCKAEREQATQAHDAFKKALSYWCWYRWERIETSYTILLFMGTHFCHVLCNKKASATFNNLFKSKINKTKVNGTLSSFIYICTDHFFILDL